MPPTNLSASASTIFEYISTPSFHSYFPNSMSFSILSRQWIILSLSQADMAPYTNEKFPVRKKECTYGRIRKTGQFNIHIGIWGRTVVTRHKFKQFT
jgi:hypothetical protein